MLTACSPRAEAVAVAAALVAADVSAGPVGPLGAPPAEAVAAAAPEAARRLHWC